MVCATGSMNRFIPVESNRAAPPQYLAVLTVPQSANSDGRQAEAPMTGFDVPWPAVEDHMVESKYWNHAASTMASDSPIIASNALRMESLASEH